MFLQDIVINAGDDFEMIIEVYNDDGSDYNIDGCTWKGEVRDRPYGIILGSFSFEAVSGAINKIKAKMSNAVTSALVAAGKSVYDPEQRHYSIKMTTAASVAKTAGAGYAMVTPEVTQ